MPLQQMLEKWEVVIGPPPNAIEFKHLQSTNKRHKHHNQNHDYKQLSAFGTKMLLEGSGHGTFFEHEKQPPTSYQISRLLTFSLRQTCFMFFSFLKTIIPRARSRKLGTKMGPVFGSSKSTSIWRLRIRSLQEEKAFVIKNQVMGWWALE